MRPSKYYAPTGGTNEFMYELSPFEYLVQGNYLDPERIISRPDILHIIAHSNKWIGVQEKRGSFLNPFNTSLTIHPNAILFHPFIDVSIIIWGSYIHWSCSIYYQDDG